MALSSNFAASLIPSPNPNSLSLVSLATPFSYKPISRYRSLPTMASLSISPSLGISETFVRLKEQGKVAFIPYITAGDPDLSTTSKALKILDSCGSDIIELGMPYSDPLADGPVIQAAATRALAKGTNFNAIISMLHEVVPQLSCPIALFTYYNPILKRGIENFISTIKNVGVHGLVVPDVPLEETEILRNEASKHHMELATNKPVAVGFGISKPEHVKQVACWGADGVIVGSAMVKILAEAKSPEEGLKELENFTKLLKAAVP
ncbi:hypothetical protein IEQ34_012523 [Dendrobium chrysotoxum]|uniref:tryptophan synthase n=1 Tax=Dendrobium chrysotoxum TaxID=161865 RepID=A0AAV7GVX1_DENCH|nr:hypothetical protein IEQ34_012523 [Dendrobium chrysotoxum]